MASATDPPLGGVSPSRNQPDGKTRPEVCRPRRTKAMQADKTPYGSTGTKDCCCPHCEGRRTEMPDGEVIETTRPVQFVTALEIREANRRRRSAPGVTIVGPDATDVYPPEARR